MVFELLLYCVIVAQHDQQRRKYYRGSVNDLVQFFQVKWWVLHCHLQYTAYMHDLHLDLQGKCMHKSELADDIVVDYRLQQYIKTSYIIII